MSNTKRNPFIPGYLKKKKNQWGPAAVVTALGLCLIASLFYWDQSASWSKLIPASFESVYGQGQYWRLFTGALAHADLEHYLSNMLMLGFLVYFTTSFYGLWILPAAFLAGALVNMATLAWIGEDTVLVGASGIVYLLWGFWLSLYFLIQKNISIVGRILRTGAVFLVMLIPTTYSPSTSYFAHYFGFFVGLVAGFVLYQLGPQKPTTQEIEEEIRKGKPAARPQPWEEGMEWAVSNEEENASS